MGQAAEVIVEELVLALVGLSAGAAVAGGLFSFIVELGVIADFADRTHTGDKLLFYETCVALGGIIGNIVFLFYSFAPNAVSFASASFASGAVQVPVSYTHLDVYKRQTLRLHMKIMDFRIASRQVCLIQGSTSRQDMAKRRWRRSTKKKN